MVLQQAPKRAKVWGFAAPGSTVSVTLDGVALGAAATTASDGRWEALLPAVAGALGTEHNVTAASAGQATIVLRRLLFGEVWICSGQSNMVRPVNWANASALEIKHAAKYDNKIRLFMVCNDSAPHCHAGSGAPLADFRFVDTQWLAPTSPNGQQLPAVAKFAASCWYFGRDLWDGWSVAQKVPLGLVLSSVGGTRDQCWSSPTALAACPSTRQKCTAKHGGNSGLWNSLIHPMLGLSFRGAVWYQGEANSADPLDYNCSFPAMIDDWRSKFHLANAQMDAEFPFGFVQLNAVGVPHLQPAAHCASVGCLDPFTTSKNVGYAPLRWAQSAGYGYAPNARQKNTFMAVVLDTVEKQNTGMGNYSVHSIYKQPTGARLATGALATVYSRHSTVATFHTGPVPQPGSASVDSTSGEVQLVFGGYGSGFEVRNDGAKGGFEVYANGAWHSAPIKRSWESEAAAATVVLEGSWHNATHLRYLWHSTPCTLLNCPIYSDGSYYKLPASPFFVELHAA